MNFCQFFGIYGVESQKRFKNKIYSYFNIRSNGRIPINVLRDVSNLIAYQLYNDYKGSWAKYPKSRKRYSKLKIEDLEHLYWQNEILSLIKRKFPEEHLNYSTILLDKNKDEVIELIKKQEEFEAMF